VRQGKVDDEWMTSVDEWIKCGGEKKEEEEEGGREERRL
jgi:hypothetical protein